MLGMSPNDSGDRTSLRAKRIELPHVWTLRMDKRDISTSEPLVRSTKGHFYPTESAAKQG